MPGYGTLTNQFRAKWVKNPRLAVIEGYIGSRLAAIDARLFESFRYVDPSPDNAGTFSYEFSSILRDCGSVFDSVMRELLKVAGWPEPERGYDIRDHKKFLASSVDRQAFQQESPGGIESVVVTLNSPWVRRHVIPYRRLADEGMKLEWWDAYNDVKHSDLENVRRGNLANTVNAVGALVVLSALIGEPGRHTLSFGAPMLYEPMDEILSRLF